MGLVFFLTFNVIGLFFQNLMEMGIDALTGVVDTALTSWNVNAAVHSLVIDGIFTGVGSVLSFMPIVVVLVFYLTMLEAAGAHCGRYRPAVCPAGLCGLAHLYRPYHRLYG